MYGIQTERGERSMAVMFENDVKMYGIQTQATLIKPHTPFENDVKMYGIQTASEGSYKAIGLRMM